MSSPVLLLEMTSSPPPSLPISGNGEDMAVDKSMLWARLAGKGERHGQSWAAAAQTPPPPFGLFGKWDPSPSPSPPQPWTAILGQQQHTRDAS